MHYFHFSHRLKPSVPSSLQFRTSLQNKRKFLALSKDFSAVSAGVSEVITASLDRQFDNFADFADLSTASLDSTHCYLKVGV